MDSQAASSFPKGPEYSSLIIASPTTSENEKCIAMTKLREYCFNANGREGAVQEIASRYGAVEALVELAAPGRSSHVRSLAFDCLIEVCFNNETISFMLGEKTRLVQIVRETLEDPACDNSLKSVALTSVINPAGNSWRSHPSLSVLIPNAVAIIRDPKALPELRLRAVMLCNNLAYNAAMQQALVGNGALEALKAVVVDSDGHHQLAFFVASLALANLDPNNCELLFGQSQSIIVPILSAFGRVLEGKDYPPGSNLYGKGWKLAMTLCKLCDNATNRQELKKAGLMKLLVATLQDERSDECLVHHCLQVLWKFNPDS